MDHLFSEGREFGRLGFLTGRAVSEYLAGDIFHPKSAAGADQLGFLFLKVAVHSCVIVGTTSLINPKHDPGLLFPSYTGDTEDQLQFDASRPVTYRGEVN